MKKVTRKLLLVALTVAFSFGIAACSKEEPLWQEYSGTSGPGVGKKIVLISGDEEYRSEEAMPQLGKMLATQHGFECVTLFAQNPAEPGRVDPNYLKNIPGLEHLRDADLVILSIRFRELPDEQMAEIESYMKSGRPLIGLRTTTHGFRFPDDSKWAKWGFNYRGEDTDWHGGFGQRILGSTWVDHHGWHKKESTRGIPVKESPLTRGISEGDIWSAADVYTVPYPLLGDGNPVVYGQVLEGMERDDPAIGAGPYEYTPGFAKNDPSFRKNDPMMPIAWTKSYSLPGGKKGKVFASTLGASLDLKEIGVRTLLGNAAYWLLDLEIPQSGVAMDLVGDFEPSMFVFYTEEGYWAERNVRVSDHEL